VSAARTFEERLGETGALRVLVVARGWCWREAVLRVLERRGAAPVAAAGGDAVRRAAAEPLDVALVDLDDSDGAATLVELRDRKVPCIAVSRGRGRSEVAAALGASASYAVKSELDPDRLLHLVRVAASGDALFVQASRRALEGLSSVDDPAAHYSLTPRELDVLRLLAAGRTNAEIAAALHLAPSSVKKLVSRCLARLGVRNRVEAALIARRDGLVPSDDV
jgi:DNA-binding NarL/FixJ family response regulator